MKALASLCILSLDNYKKAWYNYLIKIQSCDTACVTMQSIQACIVFKTEYLKHVQTFCCKWMTNTHYYNSNVNWRTISRQVEEVIPSDHPRREASSVIQWYDLIHETWYSTPDHATVIICLLYTFTDIWFYKLFWSLIQKNSGKFAITFRFLMLRHHVCRLRFHAWNLLYATSPQKQVTNVSLLLKDSDTDSENLSSLIRLSVSDGQKTDSSNVV